MNTITKKFVYVQSRFNFNFNEETFMNHLESAYLSNTLVFDDFNSAYDKLSSDSKKEYSSNINMYDTEGKPDSEYLFDDSASLYADDFSIHYNIFEVNSNIANPTFIIFISSLFSDNISSYPKNILLTDLPFFDTVDLMYNKKEEFLKENNLKEENISIFELVSI